MRGRWWNAAVLLAAPVCLKLTPLAPALLLCALWPRRLAGRFALAVVVGFLVPFLTRPPDVVLWHYREWLDHLVDSSKERWLGFRDGWTVWLVLRQMLEGKAGLPPLQEPMDSVVYRVLQLLAAAAALGWCLLQRRADASPRRLVTVTLAMGMAWLMFFGPAIEHATYVFLAPLVTWGWLKRNSWPRGRVLIDAAFLLVMVLGWGAITRPLVQSVPLLLAALPLGTLLFALWLACGPFAERLVRERRTLSWTCFPHVQPGRP